MRNKEKVTINNVKLGLRIKVALATVWCEVPDHHSPYIWLKGKIIRIDYSKTNPSKISGVTFNAKWKKHHYYFKVENMWATQNKETGEFPKMYKCM